MRHEIQYPAPWKEQHINTFLQLLSDLSKPGFEPYLPKDPNKESDPMFCSMARYAPTTSKLLGHCSDSTEIDAYRPLPEDPEGTTEWFSDAVTPEYFATATLNQVRRYLFRCSRGERFCDGAVAGECENGRMLAALGRLKELTEAA